MKSKFPLIIILVGLIIMGIGAWQFVDMKVETNSSIKKAKALIAEHQNDPTKKTPEISQSNPPGFGDTIGLLQIPKINSELAIVEGTDPNDLKKGVGHYKGSYFPGEKGQIVLSGHRDTVFRHLGELKIGDDLKVEMPNGTFVYEITHTKIVDAKDTSIITLQNKEEELILTTCYPFRYVGNAPNRYIIY
ncbi:MAG TPA: class D sortase, partial [Neobacillus sp.]